MLCQRILIGTTIEPAPVREKVADVVVASIMTTVSTDSNIEVGV